MFGYRRREQHLATMRSMRERADMECTTVKPGRPIRVFMDGCFDVMHFGHMNAFRRAKYAINGPEGTFLVVGVNTSASVETAKGTKPLMDDDERVTTVSACKWVDAVETDCPYVMDGDYLQYIVKKVRAPARS
jgi:ethanolamine-phosphate cytidylyltransferase